MNHQPGNSRFEDLKEQFSIGMKIGKRIPYFGGISGGEPAAPYAYSGLQVILAISPTLQK